MSQVTVQVMISLRQAQDPKADTLNSVLLYCQTEGQIKEAGPKDSQGN